MIGRYAQWRADKWPGGGTEERVRAALKELAFALANDLGTTPAKVQQTLSRLLTKPILVHYDGPRAWHADIEASFAKLDGTLATVSAVGDVWCPRRGPPGLG